MATSITRSQFTQQFSTAKKHGVIDMNNLSPELSKALAGAGVSEAELRKLAGPDGQIKGAEFNKLFKVLDGFDTKPGNDRLDLGTQAAPSPAGALNDAFKSEVARNLAFAQYAQPGTKPAPEQSRLTVAANALVVPEKDRKPPVDLNMKGIDQYAYAKKHKLDGDTACFPTAKAQADQYNAGQFGKKAPAFNPPDQVIQMAYAEDSQGRVTVDSKQAALGRDYIDKCLDAGYPALVGLSYEDNRYNHDKLTDHFVTIDKRGYDDAGRLYYEFKDPGAGGRTGRLYADATTGKLFKEGDQKTRYVASSDYEVSQVRTYQGLD